MLCAFGAEVAVRVREPAGGGELSSARIILSPMYSLRHLHRAQRIASGKHAWSGHLFGASIDLKFPRGSRIVQTDTLIGPRDAYRLGKR